MADLDARRPLKSRDSKFFQWLAGAMARHGVSPNGISFFSIFFGAGAGLALATTAWSSGWTVRGCWIGAALLIQLRLIANLLDGMVAVEGGRASPTGSLWNEAPDRVADVAILVGAGYAAGSAPWLGFSAALMAVFVAYVRALGASVGAGQIFIGPMAKPHRMALLTVVAILSAIWPYHSSVIGELPSPLIAFGLTLILLGGALTALRRLRRIAQFLVSKSK